ncbi:MAG: oxygen-dependent coproporphyrinogen oxidase [Holophagales bacterium]|nr:oxygen-dependent coproporphyrinogen oxidase [Holophagales bacterium]
MKSIAEPVGHEPALEPVRTYLLDLQDRIAAGIQQHEPRARFLEERFERPQGLSRPRVIEGGEVIDRGGINFSHTRGARLPAAATERRPELEGAEFEAVSVSMIFHPVNPYAPTTHANWRCFLATTDAGERAWWFGGGFDLTPYYGFEEDCVHWHRIAREACAPFGDDVYPRFKTWCDEYFYLSHRGEPRGIGGLFYDDYDEGGFERCFELTRSIADAFLPAYLPILERRKTTPYGEREKDFQLYRRGRYVEYNLIHDRGTRFGLQSRGRSESILVSMPPEVRWRYDWSPEPGTEEARLYSDFLRPRDWADGG